MSLAFGSRRGRCRVTRYQYYAGPGDQVPPFPQFGNVIAYLVVAAEDLATAEARLAEGWRPLTYTIVPAPVTAGDRDRTVPVVVTGKLVANGS